VKIYSISSNLFSFFFEVVESEVVLDDACEDVSITERLEVIIEEAGCFPDVRSDSPFLKSPDLAGSEGACDSIWLFLLILPEVRSAFPLEAFPDCFLALFFQ